MSQDANYLLGFDARKPATPPTCTVDLNLWPRIDKDAFEGLLGAAAAMLNRSLALMTNHVNLISCIPREWLTNCPLKGNSAMLAVFATKEHLDRILSLYPRMQTDYPCPITKKELIAAGWMSIGFDVVDLTLSTSWQACGPLQTSGRGIMYTTFDDALSDIQTANREVPEHAPFSPVDLIVNRR
jgi:hypothetical protein